MQLIVLLLPYKVAIFLGSFFGSLAFGFIGKYRDIAIENLKSVFGKEKDDGQIRLIAKEVFRNLGITAAECLSLPKISGEDVLRLVISPSFKILEDALSQGKGCIVIGNHFGNWEIAPVFGAARGHKVTVIAKRIYYHRYNDFLVSLRRSKGVETLYRDEKNVLKKSLDVLKSNGILGIVPDQDVDSVDGVFVDFFGKPAYTPTGPVYIAMLSGSPVVQSFMVRKDGNLHLYIEGPMYLRKTDDRKADIVKYTQMWSDSLERYIREYPSQWAWMHKRWKTRPAQSA
ncbi:MAG: lysophospholipid acyltransferase family protein [Candidatus Omnitrophica bacterium]|nr:lysophospholipid acyltransferase family protein [Candidatus Omnitrophota bacterium]